MFNGCRTDESKVRGSPRQNPKKIWQKMRSHEKCERVGDSKRFWRSDEQVGRLVKEVSRIKGVLKISVRVEGFDVFFEKKTQQELLCVNTNAPAEKLELIKREFEELGSTSREYETYTHPKPDSSERRIARCNRRLCFRMEKELAEVKRLSKDEHTVASAAGREGDSLRKDDILLNGSVDSQDSNISNPVEILSQSVEKTEKQEIVDHADAVVVEPSESKEKCTEKEFDATLKKCDAERVDVVSGGEEQPVGQEDFVHQLAKQEAVPKASEQKVFKEDDELEKKVQRMLKRIVHRWEKANKKNWSDGSLKDDLSDDDSSDEG